MNGTTEVSTTEGSLAHIRVCRASFTRGFYELSSYASRRSQMVRVVYLKLLCATCYLLTCAITVFVFLVILKFQSDCMDVHVISVLFNLLMKKLNSGDENGGSGVSQRI